MGRECITQLALSFPISRHRPLARLPDVHHAHRSTSHKGNFEGYQHPEWVNKPLLLAEARALSQATYRTLALTCGAFLQWVLKLGIDWEKRTTQCVGSAEPLFGMTAFDDIARAVARVALIALDPAAAASLPEDGRVRVGGQFASVLDIKAAVKRVKGVELDVHISDAQAVRGMLKAKYPPEAMDIIYYATWVVPRYPRWDAPF